MRNATGKPSQGFLALRLAQLFFEPHPFPEVPPDQPGGGRIPHPRSHGESAHQYWNTLIGEAIAPFRLSFPQARRRDGAVHLGMHGIVSGDAAHFLEPPHK